MRILGLGVLFTAILSTATPARSETACDLLPSREGRVASVVDGHTLTLESGESVRLIGALAPAPPPTWSGETPWRAAKRARLALEKLVAGTTVRLAIAGREQDRHGRLLAHLFLLKDGEQTWVQGEMVRNGKARAYSLPSSRGCLRALQALESRAREERRGLWRDPYYSVADATNPKPLLSRRYGFEIVEGRVVSAAQTRSWTFLNFGEDYRDDFTIAVAARDRRHFKGSDIDLTALKGRHIRVRGWIEFWNGPVIKATHPEQIELVDPDASASAGPASQP